MSAGAYRGYGATQGIFAVESAVNELASKLNIDPVKLREMNLVKEGDVMPAYYGETATSCTLDRCVARCKEMIGWDENILLAIWAMAKSAVLVWLWQCKALVSHVLTLVLLH